MSERRIELRASTGVLDFGDVPLGQERSEEILFENAGEVAVELSSLSELAEPFGRESPGRPVLAPGAAVSLIIRFAPFDLGTHSDQLEVLAAEGASLSIPVLGTGVTALSLLPPELDFRTVLAGASKTATVALRNDLAETVLVTIDSARAPSERFVFDDDRLASGGVTIPPMSEVVVRITYRPEAGIDRTDVGSVVLSVCEAFGCRASLGLRGQGTTSAIACTTEIDFGWLALGAAETRVVACTNVSSETVILESGLLAGSTRFSLPDGFPEPGTEVQAGATFGTSIRVEGVESDVGGPLRASLQVRSRDTEGRELALEEAMLTARVGPPLIDVVPPFLDFGQVAAETTLTRTVQIFNRGRSVLSVVAVEPPEGFRLAVTQAPTIIPPGGFELLSLAWTAETGVDLEGAVRIQSDDPTQPVFELPVRGRAGPPGRCLYRLEAESVRFGSVTVFHQHTSFLALRNVGDVPCLVRTLPAVGRSDFRWADDEASFEVRPGARHLVMVDFRPTGLGRRSAQLPWYVSSPLGSDGLLAVEGSGSSRRPFVHSAFQDFGYIPQACGTVTATLTIRNATYEPIVVRGLTFSGDPGFEFDDPGFPLTVDDESFRYITIRYTPGSESAAFGRYRVRVDGLDDIEGTLYAETGTATRVTETFGPDGDENKKLDVIFQVMRAVGEAELDTMRPDFESLRAEFDRLGGGLPYRPLDGLGEPSRNEHVVLVLPASRRRDGHPAGKSATRLVWVSS